MISVCMATCNGERFIAEQLASILGQLAADDEVIISDDSSTDATLSIIRGFNDSRIRLFEGNSFRSPVFNFEHALSRATGSIIVLSDQDDIWLDNKVAVIREKFASPPHPFYLIAMDAELIDGEGKVIGDSLLRRINAGPGFLKNIFNNRYPGCSLAFSRQLLEVALPFPRRIPMHDMWLGQLCGLVGVTEFVPVTTMRYRRHQGNASDLHIRFIPWTQIKRRWFLFWHLLKRAREIRCGTLRPPRNDCNSHGNC